MADSPSAITNFRQCALHNTSTNPLQVTPLDHLDQRPPERLPPHCPLLAPSVVISERIMYHTRRMQD